MDKTNEQKKIIHSTIIQMLERMKVVDGEARYSIFMEQCEWLVEDINLENELFLPDKWGQLDGTQR
jgi:hypothetical protein